MGTYLISAVPLHGLWLLDPDTYTWFQQREPDAVIAHAIFVYDVPASSPTPTWVAQCTPAILDAHQLAEGFGAKPARNITFDCAQSWLYPKAQTGWYIIANAIAPTPWLEQQLQSATLSYTQREHWSHPALRIYKWDGKAPPDSWKTDIQAHSNGPLNFVGYAINDNSTQTPANITLTTVWEVRGLPNRPLSLMAHLIGPGGTGVAVGDGLGVPIEQWQVGDIIAQQHTLTLPPDAPHGAYTIRVGAYWLDTMERWIFTLPGGNTQDHIDLVQFSK
jgi:hypothetical protein